MQIPQELIEKIKEQNDIVEIISEDIRLKKSGRNYIGSVSYTHLEAKERAALGEEVVLVRLETSPEDIEGMIAAKGILTVRGGMTSHAAVVARCV